MVHGDVIAELVKAAEISKYFGKHYERVYFNLNNYINIIAIKTIT